MQTVIDIVMYTVNYVNYRQPHLGIGYSYTYLVIKATQYASCTVVM